MRRQVRPWGCAAYGASRLSSSYSSVTKPALRGVERFRLHKFSGPGECSEVRGRGIRTNSGRLTGALRPRCTPDFAGADHKPQLAEQSGSVPARRGRHQLPVAIQVASPSRSSLLESAPPAGIGGSMFRFTLADRVYGSNPRAVTPLVIGTECDTVSPISSASMSPVLQRTSPTVHPERRDPLGCIVQHQDRPATTSQSASTFKSADLDADRGTRSSLHRPRRVGCGPSPSPESTLVPGSRSVRLERKVCHLQCRGRSRRTDPLGRIV